MSVARVLEIARGEIGYNRFTDPKEGTKYGRDYATRNGKYFGTSGVAFCAMGVTWCDRQAGYTKWKDYAYVPYMIQDARNGVGGLRLVDHRDARPGDWVCFDFEHDGVAGHVGFVEINKGSHLQTIEFNTSTESNANGGQVARCTRDWDDVCAIIRPPYEAATSGGRSWSVGKLAVDGLWGRNTTIVLQEVAATSIDNPYRGGSDGIVSSQNDDWEDAYPCLTTGWDWVDDPHGSQLIEHLQWSWNMPAGDRDGIWGNKTAHAMGAYYSVHTVGNAIKKMQEALNRQRGF